MFRLLLVVITLALTACAGTSLPYKPERQPSGARLSAAYQIAGDQLRIEIETSGSRVEEAFIVKADNVAVRPLAMTIVPTMSAGSPFSIGIGGGTYGGGGGVGVGTGVSVNAPIGGSSKPDGNTLASFGVADAGPPPWRLLVKLAGVSESAIIVVGTAPGGSR